MTPGKRSIRTWVIAGIGAVQALVLGANAHFLYVAVTSAPGCAETTRTIDASGETRSLQPAKGAC